MRKGDADFKGAMEKLIADYRAALAEMESMPPEKLSKHELIYIESIRRGLAAHDRARAEQDAER